MIERLKDPDFRGALPYFAVGAVKGVYKYYIQPEMTPKRGWLVLAAGVATWNIAAPKGNSLSEGVDIALEANKTLTILGAGYVAAHLMNVLPERIDVIHQAMKAVKG